MTTSTHGYITDVEYTPGFYANLAPVAIRYAATLNRVAPPRVADGFRYLELGCGLGRSLTTLAAANPRGEFVGVDINPVHTRAAAQDAEAGGLTNVQLVTADFAALSDDLGTFDFIVLHGVLSWVAPDVRESLLQVVRDRLAPGGLALASYNALPGWAALQPIRGILRQYAQLRSGDSVTRLRDALAYLVFIRDRHARYFDDNPRAAAYVDGLLRQDPRYLVHEYLHEHWASFYFADVATMFTGLGMEFVGSLPVFTNFWDLCVRPEFQELFRTTTSRLVTEAHKDFCANTAFRWDLYTREPRPMPTLEDRLREADDFHFRLAKTDVTLPYQTDLGVVTTTVQGPVYESLLAALAGGSLRLSALLADPGLQAIPRAEVVRAVDAGVALGLFEVTGGAVEAGEPPAEPFAVPHAFNRAVLESDLLGGHAIALASRLTGTGHVLGDLDAAILHELVAGGRDGLAGRIATRLEASRRSLARDGRPVVDPDDTKRLVDGACEAFCATSLPQLARLGIVSGAGA